MAKKAKAKKKHPEYQPAIPDTEVTYREGLRIAQAFVYADLRFMLTGLKTVLRRHRIKLQELGPGQCIPFINTNRDYVKVIIGNGSEDPVLACYRFPKGKRMPMEAITEIYKAFGHRTPGISADEKLKLALAKYSKPRRTKDVTPKEATK